MVEKSLRPKARPTGLGVRPRSRPISDEEGMARQEAAAVEKAKSLDQVRQFGNLEFRADMNEQLKWNPLARLGFDPDRSVVAKPLKPLYGTNILYEGIRYPYKATQEYVDSSLPRALTGVDPKDVLGRAKPGSVIVNSNTAKNPIWSHEYTHGGLEKVIEYLNEDKEYFKEKYGTDTVKLLEKIEVDTDTEKGPNEKLTEMLDDISKDADVDMEGNLIPAAGPALGGMDKTRSALSDAEASTDRVQLRKNLEKGRVNDADESTRVFFEQNLPGYAGIFKAAEDMLEKQGEPLPSEKRGWWEQKANKWLSGVGLFNQGGDVAAQTEEALGWTAEGQKFAEANPVDIKAPEGLSLKNVPSFDRPMSAGPNDEWTGRQDELGNREYKSQLDGSTYFIKPDADQRTELEKIQQDIIPAVKKYLDNPTAPSKEQTIEFLKTAAGDAWETISIPGDLVSGKKDLGDVTLGQLFEIGGGMAGASTFGKVPGGDASNTMRIFGGIGMEGSGTSKSFKKAENLLKKYNKDQQGTYGDSDAEGEVGGIGFNENKKIWEETNWYVDPNDGQWRFYIDDSKSTVKPVEDIFKENIKLGRIATTLNEFKEVTSKYKKGLKTKLGDVFEHEDLFKKYPKLKKINVEFYNDPEGREGGSATKELALISINLANTKTTEAFRSVLLHEVQHIVQAREGFVPGANDKNIAPELVQKKDTEILQKAKPFVDLKDELENESNVLERRLVEEIKKQEDNPLTGITREQELEIRKLKYYNPETLEFTGPSWTSIAKDYGVKPGQIQKAWGRVNLLDNLREENKKLNWELTKVESKLYEAMNERTNIEYEFYLGAGGEIESRLVQSMADGTKKFPVEARAEMLQKEGSKFQYQNKDGVDPLVYENKPRRNPEDVSFLDRLKGKIKKSIGSNSESSQFAQGGVVNDMNRQMKMFATGGLNDDGMQRDPVSGNEIPPGSLAKEVRDDIPAQLSEGEYVVPADVVRFFGVKHFEDLRNKAKGGLNQMDKSGRIGGEPVAQNKPMELPFKDEELQVRQPAAKPAAAPQAKMAGASMNTVKPRIGMAKGGYVSTSMEAVRMRNGGVVKGYKDGGLAIPSETPRGASDLFAGRSNLFQGYGGGGRGGALEVRTYVNAAGDTLLIPFLNGKIFNGLVIPDGFYLEGSPEATFTDEGTPKVTQDASGEVDDNDGNVNLNESKVTVKSITAPEDLDKSKSFFGVNQDFFALSPEDLGTYGEDFGSTGEMLRYAGLGAMVLGPGALVVGAIASIGRQVTHANDIANIRAAAQVATMRGYTDQANLLNARANKMVKDGGFLAKAMDKTGGLTGESIANKVIKSYTTIFDYGSKGDKEGLTKGMFKTDDAWNAALQKNAPKGYNWVPGAADDLEGTGSYQIDPNAETVSIPTADGKTIEVSIANIPTIDDKAPTGITKINNDNDDPFKGHVFKVDKDSNVVRPEKRPDDLKKGTPSVVTPTVVTPTGSDDSSDFHKEMMERAQPTIDDKPRARPFVSSRTDMQ